MDSLIIPGRTLGNLALEINFNSRESIEFNGETFTPDDTKGYFRFELSHSFPIITYWGTALYPAVIASSWNSMLHQNLNYEHQLQHYHKKEGEPTSVQDRVIGSIVAVNFPSTPVGGWKVPSDPAKTPCITGVAVFYKYTQGMNRIIGDHQGGRHQYTVSMEVEYAFSQSGFAVKIKKSPQFGFTPQDLLDIGWEYIPFTNAPDELIATYSKKKNRIVAQYKGREVSLLMGGISNTVHYAGMGLVKFGAEPTAKIDRMAASAPVTQLPLNSLADLLGNIFSSTRLPKS